jgi:predicted CXXCH cytochrome family protein
MMRKRLKVALWLGLGALTLVVAGTVGFGSVPTTQAEMPEYLGSKACLGCHVDKFANWEETGHAHMLKPVLKYSDLPGDITQAPPELQAELQKADWMVAEQRFLARDPATGELKYLNVQWDKAAGKYVPYKGGSSWEQGCAGCHTTGWDKETAHFAEPGIGCEMCHGPGRDHVLGKGDISKITVSTDAQVCGQCHISGTTMADGTRWPVGYRPGMDLKEIINLPVVDPHGTPPDPTKQKLRQYPLWAASAHARALTDLESSDHAQASCYKCHSAEALMTSLAGKTFDPKSHAPYNTVTCVACHDPHNSKEPAQLRMEPQALCTACHNGGLPEGGQFKPGAVAHHSMKEMLAGYGAIDVPQTKGAHSNLKCIDCHMTEGNHMMKIIRPEDVAGTGRKDTCTTCHTSSSSESRSIYLNLWQDSVTERLGALKADVAAIEAALQTNPGVLSEDQKTTLAKVKTNISFVEADGSKGAHNFEYTIKILTAAQKALAPLKAALPK